MPTITSADDSLNERERSTARFAFRTAPRIKQTIERAAALNGQDMSAFVLAAAYQRALETIQRHEVTQLRAEDHQAFFDALEHPPAPTDRLRAAFAHHHETGIKETALNDTMHKR
ncbi:type II toxin-antitoxin system TacA family antitoxin [Halochromatium sp.]